MKDGKTIYFLKKEQKLSYSKLAKRDWTYAHSAMSILITNQNTQQLDQMPTV
jgi:hypothetical protein